MPTTQRRVREKRQRRRDIIDAARSLFWKSGYSGTTMPDIARATELAPGTLYLYFPSKDALYAELLMEGYDLLQSGMEQAACADAPPPQQAEALIDAFLRVAMDYPEYFDILFFVARREGQRGRDVLQQEQIERLEARENSCKQIAEEVVRRGHPEFSPHQCQVRIDAVWSMLVGVVFIFSKEPREAFETVAREAKQLLLKAFY